MTCICFSFGVRKLTPLYLFKVGWSFLDHIGGYYGCKLQSKKAQPKS